MNNTIDNFHVTYCFHFSPQQVQEQGPGRTNRVQEMDTNMVHRLDKEQDMVHKMEPGMVTDRVPGKEKDKVPDKVHKLDMVPALKKGSELAPAPALSTCIPLTAGQKAACHLIDNLSSFSCYPIAVCCS